jgi:hypothetical protein
MRFSLFVLGLSGDAAIDPTLGVAIPRILAEENVTCACLQRGCAAEPPDAEQAPTLECGVIANIANSLGLLGLKYTCVWAGTPDETDTKPGSTILTQLPVLARSSTRSSDATANECSIDATSTRLALTPEITVDIYGVCCTPQHGTPFDPGVPLQRFVDQSVEQFSSQWSHDHRVQKRGRPFARRGTDSPVTGMVCVALRVDGTPDEDPDSSMRDAGFLALTEVFGDPQPTSGVDRIYVKPALKPTSSRPVRLAGSGAEPTTGYLVEFQV